MNEVSVRRRIGIYGGSFDPVHHGHLRMAQEIVETLVLDEIRLVPGNIPPHRSAAIASGAERLEMLRLATSGCERLRVDDRELRRDGPSYTIDTLRALREEFTDAESLCLVVGGDAFAGLMGWKQWQQLIELAHIVVIERPGVQASRDAALSAWESQYGCGKNLETLGERPSGCIFHLQLTQLAISSSQIRALLHRGCSARYLLPDAVLEYIEKRHLYHAHRENEG